MLTPEYLATFPDYIVELFEQYDAFVIEDFARRVAKAASVTETAEWQAIRAHEMGLAMDELTERAAELLNITQEDLKAMYREAYDTYVESDRKRFSGSGLDYDRIASSKTMMDYMKAAQKQTQRALRNIIGHPRAIKSMTGTKATILYVTPATKTLIDNAQQFYRTINVQNASAAIKRGISAIDEVRIPASVPSDMMKTLYDFTEGWGVDDDAQQINMVLVHPLAVITPITYEFAQLDPPSAGGVFFVVTVLRSSSVLSLHPADRTDYVDYRL